MDGGLPTPSLHLLWREPGIIPPASIDEFESAVGVRAPCQRRDRIDDKSKLIFRSLDFVECLLEVGSCLCLLRYIHRRAHHLDNIASGVYQRMTCDSKMLNGAIGELSASLKSEVFFLPDRLPPMFHQRCPIFMCEPFAHFRERDRKSTRLNSSHA